MANFSIARLPRIEFGAGSLKKVPDIIADYGSRILLVTGSRSFTDSSHWQPFIDQLKQRAISWQHCTIADEPSPALIDDLVKIYANDTFDAVVGIGGGSALDAAKAIAGLLKVQCSVMDYLEGVGPELPYEGPSIPFIAVPTTAGTGSEATKNAVLSVQGENGFKKSFRHDKLVAEYAIVDPDLLASCPPSVVAANGMDALTQLLESYVSLKSNAFTDALAISGLQAARDALIPLYHQEGELAQHREKMAYAALLSGITLAQVGLGSVHGLASPLGAFYPIPHGVVCGTLVASATRVNIHSMLTREPDNRALTKYVQVAEILCQKNFSKSAAAFTALIDLLTAWTDELALPRLAHYGLQESGFDKVIANCRGSSMKTNPIVLKNEEIKQIMLERL
ncbi:MAG: iron-containing alcohol dehydrogenase [Nitrosomonas sp.]|uniref:iron-containing alcohol dehydrogenase n=1 Tax=Nitrosomonas sp. TaxID=42353 RepID=UPI002730DC43|nr:iron-containing alcohol dehydrogenase [Nitrosomonas sp.]MDP2223724.1 iron-containing alcohol dehydrogenase [Nitrosomonas sp.]MDP3280767.1 iron-containing alcohol dehydrogenase [Nitrosomonas sp.]